MKRNPAVGTAGLGHYGAARTPSRGRAGRHSASAEPASSSARARGRHGDRNVPGAVSMSGVAPQETRDPEPLSRLPPRAGARGHPGLRAGRAARASPPCRYRALPPGSGPRAVLPQRNGTGHAPCLPSRTERPRAVSRGRSGLTFPAGFCEPPGALSAILPLPSPSPGGGQASADPTEPASGGREADGRAADGPHRLQAALAPYG